MTGMASELRALADQASVAYAAMFQSMRNLNEWRYKAQDAGCWPQAWNEIRRDYPFLYLTYLIRDIASGDVKIGKTRDPVRRFKMFSTTASRGIEILLCVPAARSGEPELHDFFDDSRLCGEWFAPSTSLLAFIETINPRSEIVRGRMGSRGMPAYLLRPGKYRRACLKADGLAE